MSKDDEYWHTIMHSLGNEFMDQAEAQREAGDIKGAEAWDAAAAEVKATADQALTTAGTAARLVGKKVT